MNKKLLLLFVCTVILSTTACRNNNIANADDSSIQTSTGTQKETNSEEKISNVDAGQSEKVYYIQHGPGDPNDETKKWEITDTEKVQEIDEWYETISEKLDNYKLENYSVTSNSIDWYTVSTESERTEDNYFSIDLSYLELSNDELELQKNNGEIYNFSIGLNNYYLLPDEDIAAIYKLLNNEQLNIPE